MTNEQFERLLYEEESTTLDFKKEQYPFVSATEDEKSELLKDIIGFANAWRRSEAYILIGVEDVRGGRSNVIGIPASDHLPDHSLQQFVKSLTNRPVHFSYEAFGFEGKQVGIIRVEKQDRPIYLKRDYGKLKKQEVYVRRGSMTDPTKPAMPEEIAQMGKEAGDSNAELVVEFADLNGDGSLGTRLAWNAEFCNMPDSIPDLVRSKSKRQEPTHPFGISIPPLEIHHAMDQLNADYFRDLADFESHQRLCRPIRLLVKVGQVAARNVRAELIVPKHNDILVLDASEMPDPPDRQHNPLKGSFKGIRPIRRHPGEVNIDRNDERFRINIDCGDLQPGRSIKSEKFFIAKVHSGEFSMKGQVFADNLPQPKEFSLTIAASVSETSMTVEELLKLRMPKAVEQ